MKLSKIFHFLYFAVLSIPLVSIPIFAIYSQNHEINDNTLQIQENLKVDFNQLVQDGDFNSLDNWYKLGTGDFQANNNMCLYTPSQQYGGVAQRWFDLENNKTYIMQVNCITTINNIQFLTYDDANNRFVSAVNIASGFTGVKQLRFTPTNILDGARIRLTYSCLDNSNYGTNYFSNVMLFDLTQMFGEGNEPTLTEFNDLLPNSYYQYTESQEMIIENAYTTTYDDTDIMSQFLYSEYNFMDKYLGIYKYQPFSGIYSWIQNTFFSGNAPLVFTIFYQWFAYWLLVSLFWLIFDVLIYVPMVAHRWLDKGALE